MSVTLTDFTFEAEVPPEVIEKYQGRVPEEVIEVWQKYGFGSAYQGFLKIVNPDEYEPLIEDVVDEESCQLCINPIVIFATAMGDLLIWENQEALWLLNIKKGRINGISAGFEYFFPDIDDQDPSLREKMEWAIYEEAVEKYGSPAYDECFGYVPLLVLSGAEKVERLQRMKLKEHIYMISQFTGGVTFRKEE